MVEQVNTSNTSLIHSEGKLMEWIQQHRPRTSVKETMDSKSPLGPEKLPYYGKYCGSFVENVGSLGKYLYSLIKLSFYINLYSLTHITSIIFSARLNQKIR